MHWDVQEDGVKEVKGAGVGEALQAEGGAHTGAQRKKSTPALEELRKRMPGACRRFRDQGTR